MTVKAVHSRKLVLAYSIMCYITYLTEITFPTHNKLLTRCTVS